MPMQFAADGVLALPDWGLIRARGDDAARFLQSQLTQDVTGLSLNEARLAGWCSAKGRLLATFVVWRAADGAFFLACSADLLAATLKRLSMFVLRAKCKLDDASPEFALHGAVGSSAQAVHPGRVLEAANVTMVGLAPGDGIARALWVAPRGAMLPAAPVLDASQWAWLEVASGVPRIAAATAELFVPQMVNFELVGGVDFQKGCYPGQEVVARSQYRGTLKRRAALFASPVAARPAQELFWSADPGQPAGQVVLAASWGGSHRLLAEAKLAALESGSLHLDSAQGPALERAALPYALTAAA
ncbi:MAG TPA: folate-binding protein [Burkholderiaceae bacterium]|nr:folate-binding protein [Burkholderiaceae bacterium]